MILNPFTLPQSSAGGLNIKITNYSAGYQDSFTLDSNCVAFILSRTYIKNQLVYIVSSPLITIDEIDNVVVSIYTDFSIDGIDYGDAGFVGFGRIEYYDKRKIKFNFDNKDITIKQFF